MKSFKTFLFESEGIYDSMRGSIEQRLRDEHKKRHLAGQIPESEMTREHIRQYRLHNALLEQVPGRSRIDHHDFDFSDEGQDEQNKFRMYRFYVPSKVKSAPHHVAVKIAPGADDEWIDKENPKTDQHISFSIDGQESTNALPEMDLQKQHAVYSGVMDAVAHHHYDTGTHPDEYVHIATASDRSKQKAKARRYSQIDKILRASV